MYAFSNGWYLLYTRPKYEKKVTRLLTEKGLMIFFPTVKRTRQWSDRKKLIIEPLFPSYVFVYIQTVKEFMAGQDTDGVINYVRFGKAPAHINESLINDIRLIVGECEDIEVSGDYFGKGQQLLIQEGPLVGLSCEMVQYNGKDKALVRVDLLQRSLLVNVPSSFLTLQHSG
jgi:transcriptional antiterminator RfaH